MGRCSITSTIATPKEPKFLFDNRSDLEGQPLQKMHSVVIDARDGMKLVSYLTLPPGSDPDGKGRPKQAGAVGAKRARRTLGPRRVGLRSGSATVGQSRLRCAERELPRLDRFWQRSSSTPAIASGPARCTTICSTRSIGP